jgi:phosphoglycerate dehydrogenase-like enzyme
MIEVGTVGVDAVPVDAATAPVPLVTEATQVASDWMSALESELPKDGIPPPP